MQRSKVFVFFVSQLTRWVGIGECPSKIKEICHQSKLVTLMNNVSRMFIPSSRRAISTALRPVAQRQHLPHPQKTFVRGATVVPGIFPIHKLPLLTFLRHQSVSPKSAEIQDARP